MIDKNQIEKELIKIRRTIHMYPELGFKEKRTSMFIAKILKNLGIEVKTGVAGTGVVGLLKGEKKSDKQSKCIAIRADMDALPITEATDKSYKSRIKGIMHACGHDGNVSIVLGSAMFLAGMRKDFSGMVKFIFQPSEETGNGAKKLIEEGVLEKPGVDIIIGVHVNPGISVGKIGIKYGEMMAAVDMFSITIRGKCVHAAVPHKGVDAILVASEVVKALQNVISRQIDPVDPCVITVGTIKGGVEFNVLAEEVVMTGTVRTVTKSLWKNIPSKIEKIVKGVCNTYGATCFIDYKRVGHPLINNFKIVEDIHNAALTFPGKKNVVLVDRPSMGGEDFAEYLDKVPGGFVYIGVGNKAEGMIEPWHSAKFDMDERSLIVGGEFIKNVVLKWL